MGFNTSSASQREADAQNWQREYQLNTSIPQTRMGFAGTPYENAGNYLTNQLAMKLGSGDKSGTSEAWRQIEDLQRFMAIMGNGPGAYFDIAQRNLGQRMGSQIGQAQNTAAALAGSRGLVNPSASILGAGTGVRQQYVPIQGQLEAQRAQATQDFLRQLLQYMTSQGQERARMNAYNEASDPNFLNYLGTTGQFAGGVGLLASGLCWVAEALYGRDDPRTWFARYEVMVVWLESRTGRFFRNLYQKHGVGLASKIKKHGVLKFVFKPVFEFIWRNGRKHLWVAE